MLAYLEPLSAHSDVADALQEALAPLGDVQLHCPDWASYRYVAASTKGVVFALAVGMNCAGFRLDQRMRLRAFLTGGAALEECGADWVAFTLFRSDWPEVDLVFWARHAYLFARELR
ncbi:MAG: hypothetical protein L0170_11505 [Acidobacteria bacterium]|nr:hypothetical protein [Acidobacteriota bacterium]